MSGNFYLDWATLAVSLVNMVLLFWLAGTVLLNAERRSWALLLVGGGLLLGGAFFLAHTAILGRGALVIDRGLRFWWRVGLSPAILLPFAWYLMTLWYAGFWEHPDSTLRRRHTPWFAVAALMLLLGGSSFVIVANPFLHPEPLLRLRGLLFYSWSLGRIPLPALGYPLYIVLCTALALDALRHPAPAARVMGELARQRARPWLVATTFVLLAVGLLVGWAILWVVPQLRQEPQLFALTPGLLRSLAWIDLATALLVALATVLVGQAIVAYELFTGKTLPRRGLRRHWRTVLLLALGYGLLVGWSLALQLRLVYSLLLTTLLMTIFHALLSSRAYVERDRYITHLRPFVTSERLYERLLAQRAAPEGEAAALFRALCEDVLGTRAARLVAVGPLAPLVGEALRFPPAGESTLPDPASLVGQLPPGRVLCVPLSEGAWAVPLWSEAALAGILVLGPKADGGLYAEEEMEIARASGERLLDTQASAELARRLMALQRQRVAESQLLDQRTRRVLHDEVLPRLHTAILELSGSGLGGAAEPSIAHLTDAHRQISNLLHALPPVATSEVARLGLPTALRRVAEQELAGCFDEVRWQFVPPITERLAALPPLAAEPLYFATREAMRNAARHGRSAASQPLTLSVAARWQGGLELIVEDDGVGTRRSPSRGGGQGLALHSTMMAVVGGTLAVQSSASGTRVLLALPEGCWRDDPALPPL